MNQSFRVIFQAANGAYVAVSELTKSKGKTKSSRALRRAAVAGMLALGAASAMASENCVLPDGQRGIVDNTGMCVTEAAPFMGTLGGSDGGSAPGGNSVALGPDSVSNGLESTALGYSTITGANATNAIAVGNQVTVNAAGAIGIGGEAGQLIKIDVASTNAIAIGQASTVANSVGGIAFGDSADVINASNGIAIGSSANATADRATAIGANAGAGGINAVAVGASTTASGVGATAFGFGAVASGNASIAIGGSQNAGTAAQATQGEAIAIGENSRALAGGAVALGGGASVTSAASVALGQGAVADRNNTVSVGSATLQRQITNVAAGTANTDAANVAQLKGITTALGGGATVAADGTITQPVYTLNGKAVTGVQAAFTNLDGRVSGNATEITNIKSTLDELGDGTIGLVQQDKTSSAITVAAATGGTSVDFTGTSGARSLNGVANGLIAAGSLQAINGGQLFQVKDALEKQLKDLTDLTGGVGGIADLRDQLANHEDRLDTIEQGIKDGTIGAGTTNPENGNSQIGTGAIASGKDATAIGNGAIASGDSSTATGTNSTASGKNSTATGAGSIASGDNSTANGANAKASGENSTALGANSSATGSNSVAIGEGSVADRDNSVSFGSAGNERQLTNVADGTAPTDAVNKRQLDGAIAGVNDRIDRLDTRVDEMGAMSSAQAQMAMSTAGLLGNNRLGVGIGAQNGQSALALGYQRVYGQGTRTLSFGGAASTRGTVSVGAGAGFSW